MLYSFPFTSQALATLINVFGCGISGRMMISSVLAALLIHGLVPQDILHKQSKLTLNQHNVFGCRNALMVLVVGTNIALTCQSANPSTAPQQFSSGDSSFKQSNPFIIAKILALPNFTL